VEFKLHKLNFHSWYSIFLYRPVSTGSLWEDIRIFLWQLYDSLYFLFCISSFQIQNWLLCYNMAWVYRYLCFQVRQAKKKNNTACPPSLNKREKLRAEFNVLVIQGEKPQEAAEISREVAPKMKNNSSVMTKIQLCADIVIASNEAKSEKKTIATTNRQRVTNETITITVKFWVQFSCKTAQLQ